MYEGVRQYADSFADHEYGELRDEEELEFANGSLADSAHAWPHARLLFFCSRSGPNSDCRRLCAQANYAQPDSFTRSDRSYKTLSLRWLSTS